MKVSEKRMLLYLAGKIILKIRPIVSGNGQYFKIMSFNGAGWSTWTDNLNYRTEEEAKSAINLAVEMNPSIYMSENDILSIEIKPFLL